MDSNQVLDKDPVDILSKEIWSLVLPFLRREEPVSVAKQHAILRCVSKGWKTVFDDQLRSGKDKLHADLDFFSFS